MGYLIALQDWTVAAQIVESQFRTLLNAEDFQGIKRRLDYFPEDFIATRPGLLLIQAWITHFRLRLVLMRSLTDKIQAMLDAALQQTWAAESSAPLVGFEIIPHSVDSSQCLGDGKRLVSSDEPGQPGGVGCPPGSRNLAGELAIHPW